MRERESLYQAILDEPDDDAPRLVYADWLEENGDVADQDQAAFIRTQVELARLPPNDDRRTELLQREQSLLSKRHRRWRSDLTGMFERDFPVNVGPPSTTDRRWDLPSFAALDEACSRYPIREFSAYHLRGGANGFDVLGAWPGLARMRAVSVGHGGLPQFHPGEHLPGVLCLARSPYVAGLRDLRLAGMAFGGEGLEALANSPMLPALEGLDITHNEALDDGEFQSLANSPLAGRLRRFAHAEFGGSPSGRLRPLLDCAALEQLVTDADHFAHLLGCAASQTLRVLRRVGAYMGEDREPEPDELQDAVGLLAWIDELRLDELSLEEVDMRGGRLAQLAASPSGATLRSLRLERCGLDSTALPSLSRILAHGKLRRLYLSYCPLKQEDAEEMSCWPELRCLHEFRWMLNECDEEAALDAFDTSPHKSPWLRLSS